MAGPAREELVALAAIFCGPDEWEVLSLSGDYRAPGTGRPLLPAAEPGVAALGAPWRSGALMRERRLPGTGCVGAGASVRRPPKREPCRAAAGSCAANREPDPQARAPPPARPGLPRPSAPRPTRPSGSPTRPSRSPTRRFCSPRSGRSALSSPTLSLAVPYLFFSSHLKKRPILTPLV